MFQVHCSLNLHNSLNHCLNTSNNLAQETLATLLYGTLFDALVLSVEKVGRWSRGWKWVAVVEPAEAARLLLPRTEEDSRRRRTQPCSSREDRGGLRRESPPTLLHNHQHGEEVIEETKQTIWWHRVQWGLVTILVTCHWAPRELSTAILTLSRLHKTFRTKVPHSNIIYDWKLSSLNFLYVILRFKNNVESHNL